MKQGEEMIQKTITSLNISMNFSYKFFTKTKKTTIIEKSIRQN